MRRTHYARGVSLLFMTVWAVSRGVAYLPGFEPREVPEGVQLLIEGLPALTITGYGVLWLVAAVLAFVAAFVQRDLFGFLAILAMGSLAGMAFTCSWLGSYAYSGAWNGDWRQAGQYVGTTGALLAAIMRPRRRPAPAVRREEAR